jgi:hypothetical protein
MKSSTYTAGILGLMVIFWAPLQAQKDIDLGDSLNLSAEKMKVKMGTQWFGKIWKFSFGDYAVRSSKMGWGVTSSRSNFFNTKTESESTQKFSFAMTDGDNNTAHVNAAENIKIKRLNEIEVLPHLVLGGDEILLRDDNFSAFITINEDTNDVWALLLNEVTGTAVARESSGILTNGVRKITLMSVITSNNAKRAGPLAARGYELVEGDHSISAVQYYGGGLMGQNRSVVWFRRDLDNPFKLMLAAAMTAILQVRIGNPNMRD